MHYIYGRLEVVEGGAWRRWEEGSWECRRRFGVLRRYFKYDATV